MSVTERSGGALEAELRTLDGFVFVNLVVNARLLSRAPLDVTVRVAGSPSVHAVRYSDGTRVASTRSAQLRFESRLAGKGTTRLMTINGEPLPSSGRVECGRTATLRFDGVLDPESVTTGTFPLTQVVEGVPISAPIQPQVQWRCVGRSFEVELTLPGSAGVFQLGLRRTAVKDLQGQAVEPGMIIELVFSPP